MSTRFRILAATSEATTEHATVLFRSSDPFTFKAAVSTVRAALGAAPTALRTTPRNSLTFRLAELSDPAAFRKRVASGLVPDQAVLVHNAVFPSARWLSVAFGYRPKVVSVLLSSLRLKARRQGLPAPREFRLAGWTVQLVDKPDESSVSVD